MYPQYADVEHFSATVDFDLTRGYSWIRPQSANRGIGSLQPHTTHDIHVVVPNAQVTRESKARRIPFISYPHTSGADVDGKIFECDIDDVLDVRDITLGECPCE